MMLNMNYKSTVHRKNTHGRIDGSQLWAIGGGKGGIGKSFISSSLAITLARMGMPVTLVDLDLGSANLHTSLGIAPPQASLTDFISGRVSRLRDVSVGTNIPNLHFISGFNDALNIADLKGNEKDHLIHSLRSLSTPYVVLDLGAGTGENTLDFFLEADRKVVTVVPEPTSVENAYRFIKSAFYRKLKSLESQCGIESIIDAAMDSHNNLGIKSPADLIRFIKRTNPDAGSHLEQKITEFHLHLLLNQIRTRADIDLGQSMVSVCRKYFGVSADYLGYIDHDNAVWQSLRKKRPLLIEHPYSSIVGQFTNVTKNLMNTESFKAVV